MIIGLMGSAGSGKTTIAKYLTKNYGFKEKAFADPMKEALSILFSIPKENFYIPSRKMETNRFWSTKAGTNITPRLIMQKFGTECMREMHKWFPEMINIKDNFWTETMSKWIETNIKRPESRNGDRLALSDVRFANEVKLVSDFGGFVIYVHRDSQIEETNKHVSEKISNVNTGNTHVIHVDNNDEIEDLHRKIDSIMFEAKIDPRSVPWWKVLLKKIKNMLNRINV